MIALFIDTSISFPTISLIKDNNIIFEYHEKIENDMSSKILPIIDSGLKDTGLLLELIDKIFVVNGPGSFTGIRIGVSIVKTIAWALKKNVIPISSLEFIATTPTKKKYLVPMIDARRNNVFGAIFDNDLNCVKKETLINIDELINDLNDDYELVSYDNIDNSIFPKPDVIKVMNKHINDVEINPHNLKPNYLKLTEAEEIRLKND